MSSDPIYDLAQEWLTKFEDFEKMVLPVIDPNMGPIVTDALNAIKTVLATTWGGQAGATPEAIDATARAALDAKFPGK